MHRVVALVGVIVKLLLACVLGVFLVTLRYILRTPQPLDSALSGEARLYKWKHGYIYYKVMGAVGAQPLVLFHSPAIGASGYEIRSIAEELARDYRVYVPDLPGFGLSDRPPLDYSAQHYVTFLQDYLREVVQQPAILLASGLSCNYCIAVANSAPALCQRVVLLTPLTIFEAPRRITWLAALATNKVAGFVLYAFVTSRQLLRIIVNRRHEQATASTGSDELESIFASAHQFGAQHAALALLTGKLDLEVAHLLQQLPRPVQMIWGEHAMQALSRLPSAMPQVRIDIIENGGFCPHKEQLERVLAYIQAYEEPQEAPVLHVAPVANVKARSATSASSAARMEPRKKRSADEQDTAIDKDRVEPVARVHELAENLVIQEETTINQEGAAPQAAIEAYCVKCKSKRAMQNAQKITTRNGRSAIEGRCPVCGTRLFRFAAR